MTPNDTTDQERTDTTTTPPATIYLHPDLSDPQAAGLFEGYGDLINSVPVIEEEHIPGCDHCEQCGDADGEAYRLPDERHGIPVCRDCLESTPWVLRVEEERPGHDRDGDGDSELIVAGDGSEIVSAD